MNKSLLPIGSSRLEKQASEVLREALKMPVLIHELINPDTCPLRYLPYLAWAFSVDYWNEFWTEQEKRHVIKQAFFVHKHKGTIASVKRVIEPFGYLVELVEWFDERPEADQGTFRLKVGVGHHGITEEVYKEIYRLVSETKPVSRKLRQLMISLMTEGNISISSSMVSGEIVTIYPAINNISLLGHLSLSSVSMQCADTLIIYPYMMNKLFLETTLNLASPLFITDTLTISGAYQ